MHFNDSSTNCNLFARAAIFGSIVMTPSAP
jgi:hypothetical protein